MTPEEQQDYVMDRLVSQAKQSLIVKVLERIAESLESLDRTMTAIESTHAPAHDADGKEIMP